MRMTKAFYYAILMALFALTVSADPAPYQQANINDFQWEHKATQQVITKEQNHHSIIINAIQSLYNLEIKINNSIHMDEEQLNNITDTLKKIENTAKGTVFYTVLEKKRTDLLNRITFNNILIYNLTLTKKIAYKYQAANNPFNLKTQISPTWQAMNPMDLSVIKFNSAAVYQFSGLDKLLNTKVMAGLMVTLIASIMLSFYSLRTVSNFNYKKAGHRTRVHNLLTKTKVNIYCVYSLVFINIYLYCIFYKATSKPTVFLITISFFIYELLITGLKIDSGMNPNRRFFPNAIKKYCILILMVLFSYNYGVLFFYLIRTNIPFFLVEYGFATYAASALLLLIFFLKRSRTEYTEKKFGTPFLKRIILIASVAFFCFLIIVLSDGQNLPETWLGLRNTVFIILYNVSLLWINWLVFRMKIFTKRKAWYLTIIAKITLISLYFIPIIAAWNGYYHLALLWVPNIITSIMVIIILINLNRFLKYIYSELTNQKNKISRKLYYLLGKQADEKNILELIILRFLVMTAPGIIAFFALNEIWGMSRYEVDSIYNAIINGIVIGHVKLYPIRILRSVTLFCLVMFFGKMVSNFILKRANLKTDSQERLSIKALMSSFVFLFAIGLSFYISGFDATKLLFIIGGLSFGIGMGLKQFVADAGSGLYIVIEKPIKLGDHIMIQDIEGTVKKIGVLSTQITTLDHSDVLIPNSNFLLNPVVNYTYY